MPVRILSLIALLAVFGCSGVGVPDEPGGPQADTSAVPKSDVEQVAHSTNAFGVDLLTGIAPGANAAISPASISLCTAMAAAGAEGETRDEMNGVLHIDLPDNQFHPAAAALVKLLHDDQSDGLSLRIANAIFVQDAFPIAPAYETRLADFFGAAAHPLDFTADPGGSADIINAWVAARTNDRITDIVSQEMFNAMTRLVLANAIHFDGKWLSPFEHESTYKKDFHLLDGSVKKVDTMHDDKYLPYAADETAQVLEMPYRGEKFSMLFILPRERGGLPALREQLTAERLKAWTDSLVRQQVEVALPKFEFESSYELTEPLQALGMKRAFDAAAAEFGRICTAEPLFIAKVLHKTYIRVDEEGTEAAAATAAGAEALSEPHPEPTRFIADHPFLFALRHRETGAILFIGQVLDPDS